MELDNFAKRKVVEILIRQALSLVDEMSDEEDTACNLQGALDKILNVPRMRSYDEIEESQIDRFINRLK